MKKLVLITESWLAGVRRHILLVAPALSKQGFEVVVLASPLRFIGDFAEDQRDFAQQGVVLIAWPMSHNPGFHDLATLYRMFLKLRELKPDVVWTHSTKAGMLGRWAALLANPFKVRRLYTPHCYYRNAFLNSPGKRFIVDVYEWMMARISTKVIAISTSEYEDARRYGSHLVLVPNGLPGDFAAKLQCRDSARRKLGISGLAAVVSARLVPQKGLDFLIAALAELPKPLPNGCIIHIFGEGYCEAVLKQQASAAGLDDVLIWHNYRDDLVTFLPAFDLAILPSRYEALSYSLLECLAAGLPVLASDCPGNLVDHGELSPRIHYFKTGNTMELAAILKKILETPPPTSPEQQALVLKHFSLDTQIRILAKNLE